MNPGDVDVTGLQFDHKEDEVTFQSVQREHFDRKEVTRRQPFPMRLEECLPRRTPAPIGGGGNAVVEQDPLHGVPADLVTEVGQGPAEARVAPSWILNGHPHDQLGQGVRCQRPTAATMCGAVVLLGNQSPIPAEDGVRCGDAGHLHQDPAAEFPPPDGETPPLTVRQAKRTTAQLFAEDSILLTEVVDQIVLVPVQPASDRKHEEVQRRGHPARLPGIGRNLLSPI